MPIKFEVDSKVPDVLAETKKAKKRCLVKIGLVAERYAKKIAPVQTGRLRGSITHTHDDESAYIGTNVEYAPYVELGTSRRTAKPYLKPAVQNNKDVFKKIIDEEFADLARKFNT